jgi:hypothetical protein
MASKLRRAPRSGSLLLVTLLTVAAACSSPSASGRSSAPARPSTRATLQIVSPAPNSVTGSRVDLRLRLENARIVPSADTGGQLSGDRGHIHISVDGQQVAMAYSLEQTLPPLAPGRHTVQTEFVAVDHQPFANRVVAAVAFSVR